jgi:hypothetical protein
MDFRISGRALQVSYDGRYILQLRHDRNLLGARIVLQDSLLNGPEIEGSLKLIKGSLATPPLGAGTTRTQGD